MGIGVRYLVTSDKYLLNVSMAMRDNAMCQSSPQSLIAEGAVAGASEPPDVQTCLSAVTPISHYELWARALLT
ncbi:hypothetical protein BaRGS_00022510 [Batillaria attramentaria]|uniref:Uncharacterized protein n=1 Tax=Batillaria attramentaria TaxID=370345 RepID=A0ABD0KH30_9CAEN